MEEERKEKREEKREEREEKREEREEIREERREERENPDHLLREMFDAEAMDPGGMAEALEYMEEGEAEKAKEDK